MKDRFLDLVERLASLEGDVQARVPSPGGAPTVAAPADVLPPTPLRLGKRHEMRELVVVSGKGGTGKTSVAASFFALADDAVAGDCDVVASNLHIVLDPEPRYRATFSGGSAAIVDAEKCMGCGRCEALCRFHAIGSREDGSSVRSVDALSCEGCGVCSDHCPHGAISLVEVASGQWCVGATRHGLLTHAQLGVARQNSGKLVSRVRREARASSVAARRPLLISDGSPGIGCPVIASIAGADLTLVVTEPTLAGLHDLSRIVELCKRCGARAAVCINKADLDPDLSRRVEQEATARGCPVVGAIRYDAAVTVAQVARLAVVEHDRESPAARDIRELWEQVRAMVFDGGDARGRSVKLGA
jgi:MinD superfamily P-loop ATPase